MFAANTYRIRLATEQDTDAVRVLAMRNCDQPLHGQMLIGEIDGVVSAALSLNDGRVIADSSPRAGHLLANLRYRAVATWAYSATPSTSKRMLAALPAWYRSAMVQTDAAHSERVEHEPVLAHA